MRDKIIFQLIGFLLCIALLYYGVIASAQEEGTKPTPATSKGEREKLEVEVKPPGIREAERAGKTAVDIGDEIDDRDLKETDELMEKAAEGELIVPGEEGAPPETPATREEPVPSEKPAPTEEIPIEQRMILFDFKDADITHVLRLMARKAGVNIIYGPGITGKITMSLETEIPWEKALSLILKLRNYAYIRDGNIYRVIPEADLEKEPTQTETFIMSYAKAKEVMNSVNQMLTPARGQIKADERSNTLIVTDVPAKLDQIRRIIKKLDRRTPQVLIESRIVELSDDFDEDIGVDWVMLRDWDISAGQPPGDDQHLMTFTDEWRKIDTRNVSRSFTGRAQHDGTISDPTTTQQTVVTSDSSAPPPVTVITTTTDAATEADAWTNQYVWDNRATRLDDSLRDRQTIKTAVLDSDNLAIALNFLQEQTDSNLISHPKIVTADSKRAEIKIVRQYPIPRFQYNDEIGRFEISDYEYKDIGIILIVTPYVNADDFITLDVAPEVSTHWGTTSFTGATNVDIPIIQTRKATTQVLIKDGDTLVIGGLMREDEIDTIRKVPIFGDTPFIGRYFFTNVGTDVRRRNLMIFVTANVMTQENKDVPWKAQMDDHDRILSREKEKWWQPRDLEYGIGFGERAKQQVKADQEFMKEEVTGSEQKSE